MFALKLFWNVYTWNELEDLIFYGQWTNLHDPSQNGPKLATTAWIAWFLTFIMHENTNSVVLWVILPNNADWDCLKIPILREILRTQNLLWVEHCVFGSHTFVPISWMCKKQTSVSHSSTESEIISLDAGLRLDGIPALDFWDLIVSVLGNTTQNHDRTVRPIRKICCTCSKTTKQWSNWSLKGGALQWHVFPEPTELLLIGYSIESIWTQNPNQIHRYQKPTCWHFNQREFHTWWMESSFVIV